MNRHFYNFVAIFNAAAKTFRSNFSFPLRSTYLIKVLFLLYRLGFIRDYTLPNKWHYNHRGQLVLGKRQSNYYHPVNVTFKTNLFPRIKSVTTPGKRRQYFFKYKKLLRLHNRLGAMATIIVSSSVSRGLCTSSELLAKGKHGGLVLFIVYHYQDSTRRKERKTFP